METVRSKAELRKLWGLGCCVRIWIYPDVAAKVKGSQSSSVNHENCLPTISISGYLKRLHIVLGNLPRLYKGVTYHFHKRCRQLLDKV
jgi:hypothetical protein